MRCLQFALALLLLAPLPAWSNPVTVNFTGNFAFLDFEYLFEPRVGSWADEAWAFDDAMRATGAVTSPVGSHGVGVLGLSLTFDTGAIDLDPSPDSGLFSGAATGAFSLGDRRFTFTTDVATTRGGGIGLGSFFPISGPALSAGGFSFSALDATFHGIHGPPLASDGLSQSTFADAMAWQTNLMFLRFGNYTIGANGLSVVSVSVPEISSLLPGLVGLPIAAWTLYRSRRRSSRAGAKQP